MKYRFYCGISGVIFGIVALVHLLRIINDWDLIIASWRAPLWLSYVGFVIGAGLSAWAFRLAGRGKKEVKVGN